MSRKARVDEEPQGRRSQQQRSAETRERIIESAAALFEEQGFEASSLNAIIAACGMTKGAFYHHFASKDELATAVFRSKQAQLVAGMRSAVPGDLDALSTLKGMLLARARLLQQDPALRSFLRLASELTVRFGPGSEFARSYELPIATFAELISRGQAEGTVRDSLNPRSAAETVFAALLGTDELYRVTSGGADLESRTATWLEVLLRGLAAG